MNIVYLVFGDDLLNHKQAAFSILTLLPHKAIFDNIIVVTDLPEYYEHISNSKLVIEKISPETLVDWKGEHNYLFRTKIKALQLVERKWNENSLLYLDADTFVFNELGLIKQHLDRGFNVMHINEGPLSSSKSKTKRSIWKKIKGNNYQGIVINEESSMWNAGVIGISSVSLKNDLEGVLKVCDSLCEEDVKIRLIEQLSFSLVLNKNFKLIAANKVIGHYWGNKPEWNNIINDFFIGSHLSNGTLAEEIDRVKNMNLLGIPVFVKKSSTSIRLKKIIDKLFVKTETQFISINKTEL